MKIKELFNDPNRWTQQAMARNKDGIMVAICSPEAYSFCLAGAVTQCYGKSDFMQIFYRINKRINAPRAVDNVPIIVWNDSHDFEDVKRLVEELDI